MWGIIPAAGVGSRIQPLAFSKELLPVGSKFEGLHEKPRAVSEYLIERMLIANVSNIVFVISPGKSDIIEYYGGRIGSVDLCYVVQPAPSGLCDAIFRTASLIHPDDEVLVGLPDTVWFPADGFLRLPRGDLSFLCFPVSHPELFDAVVTDSEGWVREIQVKQVGASSEWVWGAFKITGRALGELASIWQERAYKDAYVGTLANAWIERGGKALAVKAGQVYLDVGTLHGYRDAMRLLDKGSREIATR